MDSSTIQQPASIRDLFERSWEPLKKQLFLVGALSLVYVLGMGAVSMIPYIGWLFNSALTAGFIACLLRLRKGEGFDFVDFFWAFNNINRFLNVLLAGILTGILSVIGLIFLIAPGIWIYVALGLTTVLLVRSDLDAPTAMRRSYDLVAGSWWRVFGVLCFIGLLNFLGALCFFVGLLVSFPLSVLLLIELAADLERTKAPRSSGPESGGVGSSSSFAVNPSSSL